MRQLKHSLAPPDSEDSANNSSQGVQSLEIGLRIAFALARLPGPVGVAELAREVGLSRSKTHRYLVSLCRSGLIVQDGRNGRYDLGVGAIQLGLAAQGRFDEYRLVDELLDELQERTGFSSAAIVWGNHGPTIVRRKEAATGVAVNTRVGTVLPLTTSAAGRVFAAFHQSKVVKPLIEAEFRAGIQPTDGDQVLDRAGFEHLLAEIRSEGVARVKSGLYIGIDGLAAPVFTSDGTLVVVGVVGPHGALDVRPEGQVAQGLRLLCLDLSERLGGQPLRAQ